MFNRQSVHIAVLLWGGILSLLTALCMFISKNFDKEKRKCLIHMQLACAILLFSDAVAWECRGGTELLDYYLVRCSNFLVFLFSDVMLVLFHCYVCCCLFSQELRSSGKKPFQVRVVVMIGAVSMLLVVISQFTGLYYYFDSQNIYHRSSWYFISLVLPMTGMLLDLWLIVKYQRNITRRLFISLLSYIALPFAATVVLLFYYGISWINIAICISMILMFVVAVLEQNEQVARREREASDLQVSMMLSQIAPHFIYNTLTTIQELCRMDAGSAEEMIGDFSAYLRGNLESLDDKEPIPFPEELLHVKYYLAIEKRRFGDRVNVEYDIQEDDFQIPALTLQPIVENAVKHGVCRKKGGGTIWITTKKGKAGICVEVRDDGAGFDLEKVKSDGKKHIGLNNVQSRLKMMCKGTMEISSIVGVGTSVTLLIPQKKE